MKEITVRYNLQRMLGSRFSFIYAYLYLEIAQFLLANHDVIITVTNK